jgi:hypothetical protein
MWTRAANSGGPCLSILPGRAECLSFTESLLASVAILEFLAALVGGSRGPLVAAYACASPSGQRAVVGADRGISPSLPRLSRITGMGVDGDHGHWNGL